MALEYDSRMNDVRWTITGSDQFRAEVFDGPTLASGEQVVVAPAAALEDALAREGEVRSAARALLDALEAPMVGDRLRIFAVAAAADQLRGLMAESDRST